MRTILCIMAISMFVMIPAWARLGETEDQCVQRYGAVLTRTTVVEFGQKLPTLAFVKNGYMIVAEMLDGKVGLMMITKADSTDFSENEQQLLIDADSSGQKWAKQNDLSVDSLWIRDDGAQAQYKPLDKALIFVSKDFIAARGAAAKADEAKKTQGF